MRESPDPDQVRDSLLSSESMVLNCGAWGFSSVSLAQGIRPSVFSF